MGLPSFDGIWDSGARAKPRILVLEVRHPDRPEKGAVAWLVVERTENCRRDPDDESVYEASIELSYQCIPSPLSMRGGDTGRFHGSYSRASRCVSIISSNTHGGALFLDLPGLEGHRIGTYLMNEIVMWAQRWPEATVSTIRLLIHQADKANKDRRNRFYEQFGLVFDYSDAQHKEGVSRPILAKDLTPVETWKLNITEHKMMPYLANVTYREMMASSELERRTQTIKELSGALTEAYSRPIRWALSTLYRQYGGRAAIILLLLAMAWMSFRAAP